MARDYRLTNGRRLVNRVATALLRSHFSPPNYALLTVPGRTSGRSYSTPVRPIVIDGRRYLVAPYGDVSWVRNARAAGQVTLTRAGVKQTVAIIEQPSGSTGSILRAYARAVPATRPFFDARPNDSVERFAAEAARHPVFRIVD